MQVDGDWVESGLLCCYFDNHQNMKQPDRVAVCGYAPDADLCRVLKAALKAGYAVDWEEHVLPLVPSGNHVAYVDVMINAYKARKLVPAQQHFAPLTDAQPCFTEGASKMLCAAWGHPGFKFSVRSPSMGTAATDQKPVGC